MRVLETCPDINLWIDSGLDPFMYETPGLIRDRISIILGSETGITPGQLGNYTRKSDCILSLDYAGSRFLGDMDLVKQPALLPQRIIIMSLQRVGSDSGPDLERVNSLSDKLRGKQLYAAGGVRNTDDLHLLSDHGVHGALLASSLHNKTITSEQLVQLQGI